MNIYGKCPVTELQNFSIRLTAEEDAEDLFECYHDRRAVARMNDDNCDFGFYVDSLEQMKETVKYWIDFYDRECFVRFTVVDRKTGRAAGTIEGFGGEEGVLRVDLASAYEKEEYLTELFEFAKKHFREYFGNHVLVTKAVPAAVCRRQALIDGGWEFIDTFRGYKNYFMVEL